MSTPERIQLRPASVLDAARIAAIYNPYILESTISFEEQPVSTDEMARRIAQTLQDHLPWLLACDDDDGGTVLGYAYASKWRARPAYRHSVETSVYLLPTATGRGLGRRLYQALLAQLAIQGFHTAIGGIAQPNPASVALHEQLGFAKVAHFAEVGFKSGRWVDVGYWQKMLTQNNLN